MWGPSRRQKGAALQFTGCLKPLSIEGSTAPKCSTSSTQQQQQQLSGNRVYQTNHNSHNMPFSCAAGVAAITEKSWLCL